MRVFLNICASLALLCGVAAAQGQTMTVEVKPLTDSDIQLLRSDLQADKNDIITHTMKFTDAESTAFTPIYRDYAKEQQVIGDKRVQLIKDYAAGYDTMDDAKAKDMFQRQVSIDESLLKLRKDYWNKFAKALGAKRAAKFYQVDNRLTLMINLQLASLIPIIK